MATRHGDLNRCHAGAPTARAGSERSREPNMGKSSSPMNRRAFLENSAAVIAGGAVLPRTALSYENIVGANDRISLGHVGIGSRGEDLDLIASKLKDSHHVEMTAVCDLWKVNREKGVATNTKYYGRAPRAV